MKWRITLLGISAIEDVQVGIGLRVKQVVNNLGLTLFNGSEEACLAFPIALLKQIHHFLGNLASVFGCRSDTSLEGCQIASLDSRVLHRLLQTVLEGGVLLQSILEEGCDLSLEVGLAAQGHLLSSVGLDHVQRGLALLVAGETQAVPHDHLADEVILSVLDHA